MSFRYWRVALLALLGTGCAHGPYPAGGLVFHNVKGPNHAVAGDASRAKHGESCASNVLGYVAWGDASIDAAKQAGGVTQVATVDYRSFNVLGAYLKTCAIVTGT
jgi:hypothetical protein